MSYISLPRFAFSGRFQSDVSTVNNDVRHYDNATFLPRFQEPQVSATEMNGWWNPRGTGAFRLVNVIVRQSISKLGDHGTSDPATGLYISAQVERTAAKMVDLDPQFQMGSSLWGLRLALTDGKTVFMQGDYLAAPFRDLFFGRVNRGGGSANASAKYTSVLQNVTWNSAANDSPVLTALKAAAKSNGNRLSVNLMTFGYIANNQSSDFTYGNITGSIGTWRTGSPLKFVQGRRFAPVISRTTGPFSNSSNIGFFDAEVTENIVSLDLSNALPLADTDGSMVDLGDIHLAALTQPDTISEGKITPGTTEGSTITMNQFIDLGAIDYRSAGWLLRTAGLVDHKVPKEKQALINNHPLALVKLDTNTQTATILIRESFGGLMVRADTMELRVDSQSGTKVAEQTTLFATQYGAPAAKLPITLGLNPPEAGQGSSGQTNPPNKKAPTAPVPQIGTPASAVGLTPQGKTEADGQFDVTLTFTDPSNPRGYIDGQIYKVNYSINYAGVSDMPFFEQIVIHLRDAYDPPAKPDWNTDIAPILIQYGNLYPIMSHGLFSFSDENVVREHARILAFALTRDLADPAHMPATRDMSQGKRHAILNWLSGVTGEPEPKFTAATPDYTAAMAKVLDAAPPLLKHKTAVTAIPTSVAEGTDGKTAAVREMLTARIQNKTGEK